MRPPRSRWSWRLGTLAGIPVRIHATFLLLILWIALAGAIAGMSVGGVVFEVALILAVFATIVVHELGHAVVARRRGGVTREITLLPIGGIASMDVIPERPKDELAVAVVGPAINLAIAGVLAAVLALTGGFAAGTSVVRAFFVQLTWIEIGLAVFNLIPAFPLDGGRALRALLAMRGSRDAATEIAGKIGMALAVVLAVCGFFVNGWLMIIAMVVFLGAQQELAMLRTKTMMAHMPEVEVADDSVPSEGPFALTGSDGHVIAVVSLMRGALVQPSGRP
jgi:Zn-dependent protease